MGSSSSWVLGLMDRKSGGDRSIVLGKDGGKINYDKLIYKFGCQRLDLSLINRAELLISCSAHVFLRRGVFFAHLYLYLPMLTHSNNICIEGKLEFDGWIFPLFTNISMIYWMDG